MSFVGRNLWIFLIVMCGFISGVAQAQEENDLLDRSLEYLLNVTVGSKKEESVASTAAVVSVITAADIEQFGGNNLIDILNRSTSLYFSGSYVFRENIPAIRGNLETHINTNVLLLLDGRPVRESYYGGIESSIWASFPLESIDHIEIIRGPGSVLYGTNAFVGVINMVTKKAKDNGVRITAKGGSFNGQGASTFGTYKQGELKVVGSANYFHDKGWPFSATDEKRINKTIPYDQDVLGANVRAEYSDFTAQVMYAGSKDMIMGAVPQYPEQSINNTRFFTDLGYKKKLTDYWDFTFNTTYNYYQTTQLQLPLTSPVVGYYDYFPYSKDILLETTNFFHLLDKLELTVGLAADHQTGNSTASAASISSFDIVAPYERILWQLYGQMEYRPLDYLKLVAGAQVNQVPGTAANLTPRLGAIVNANKDLSFKLLYGWAFRSATAFENGVNMPGIVWSGSVPLKPEKINTLDLQMLYHTTQTDTTLTYFKSVITDQITRTVSTRNSNELMYRNQGEVDSQGVEFENEWKPTGYFRTTGSVSYQINSSQVNLDSPSVDNTSFLPNWMAKLGASYIFTGSDISLGVFDSYYSNPASVNILNANVINANPSSSDYHWLEAQLSGNLNKILNLKHWPKTSFRFFASNLLDSKVYSPEFQRRRINTIPSRPGQSLYGSVSIDF